MLEFAHAVSAEKGVPLTARTPRARATGEGEAARGRVDIGVQPRSNEERVGAAARLRLQLKHTQLCSGPWSRAVIESSKERGVKREQRRG